MSQLQESPASSPAIVLPGDQYAHTGAPTEWWWHVGTLQSADGRTFGFEINATGMLPTKEVPVPYAFTQIEITDVSGKRNYQKVTATAPRPDNWAQYDQSQPWFVKLGASGADGSVNMTAIDGNPLNMAVQALFMDAATQTPCKISLTLAQQGPPLLVWGTGVKLVDPYAKTPITQNNYYYSLTHLQASGTITIGTEEIQVTGLTWMDHEYGAFPNGSGGTKVIWLLQDIQLTDNLHLSNYTQFGVMPQEGVPMPSNATLLVDGESVFVDTITTPMGPTYVSAKNVTYFTNFKIQFKEHSHLYFLVHASYPDQVFRDPGGADVYEGVGTAELVFELTQKRKVAFYSGPAWIEQNLG
ncbi:MAG: lipocalin-like domain-containing protein [Bacteroidia bacterium]